MRLSSAVFLCEVLEHRPLKSVKLRVLERFKGRTMSQVIVDTGQNDCDYFVPPTRPRVGDKFLVFLTQSSTHYTVSRCLGTAPAASASSEIRLLQEHKAK